MHRCFAFLNMFIFSFQLPSCAWGNWKCTALLPQALEFSGCCVFGSQNYNRSCWWPTKGSGEHLFIGCGFDICTRNLCELLSQEATEKWNKKGTKYKDFLTNGIQDTASLLVSILWVGSFGLLYDSLKVWEAWEACKRKSFSILSVSTCSFPTIKSTPKDSIRREWNQIECDRQGNEVHWRTHVYLCTPSSMPSNLILKAMFFIIIDYVKF